MAKEILDLNDIAVVEFAEALFALFRDGRRKFRNVFLTGPEGCGKSFILDPLENVFSCLTKPASKYGWAEIIEEDRDVIYLNDFRWGPENIGDDGTGIIEWQQMLTLFDGSTTKFKRPRNLYASDVTLPKANTIPVFANGAELIESIAYGAKKRAETQMMEKRWKVFQFKYQFPEDRRIYIKPCGACFARLCMEGKNAPV